MPVTERSRRHCRSCESARDFLAFASGSREDADERRRVDDHRGKSRLSQNNHHQLCNSQGAAHLQLVMVQAGASKKLLRTWPWLCLLNRCRPVRQIGRPTIISTTIRVGAVLRCDDEKVACAEHRNDLDEVCLSFVSSGGGAHDGNVADLRDRFKISCFLSDRNGMRMAGHLPRLKIV